MNGEALDVRDGPALTVLRCGNCERRVGEAVLVPGLRTRHHCPRCKAWSIYTVPAAGGGSDAGQVSNAAVPFILPRRVRAALLDIRAGMLEELRADELDDDQARELRRRARIRQVRALERLTGTAPADVRGAGAAELDKSGAVHNG